MRNSTNIFLVNLSVADLCVLLICTPTVLVEVNSGPEIWLLGEHMCKWAHDLFYHTSHITERSSVRKKANSECSASWITWMLFLTRKSPPPSRYMKSAMLIDRNVSFNRIYVLFLSYFFFWRFKVTCSRFWYANYFFLHETAKDNGEGRKADIFSIFTCKY